MAAGDHPALPGVAPGADLIVVNATRVAGTLNFESADIIDALTFIDQQAALLAMPYVVNLSLGTSYGPHDGTTLEEIAIDSLVGPGKPGKVIVAAAGNSGDTTGGEYRHIQGRALAGLENPHHLVVPRVKSRVPDRATIRSSSTSGTKAPTGSPSSSPVRTVTLAWKLRMAGLPTSRHPWATCPSSIREEPAP